MLGADVANSRPFVEYEISSAGACSNDVIDSSA